jgi:hypothetical protein
MVDVTNIEPLRSQGNFPLCTPFERRGEISSPHPFLVLRPVTFYSTAPIGRYKWWTLLDLNQ